MYITQYVYYPHRQNNSETKLYRELIHASEMSHIIPLTVEILVFIYHLLKMQNFINSFENVKVLNTSLTTEF